MWSGQGLIGPTNLAMENTFHKYVNGLFLFSYGDIKLRAFFSLLFIDGMERVVVVVL